MYQKPEAEESLSPAKESSLMDRWYTKIEAICVEADKNPSLLFQEAGKYFENQVSSAGATMRKVCSELIRDLLPPPEEECKHLEKCQCKCEASKKKNIAAAKAQDQPGEAAGAIESQDQPGEAAAVPQDQIPGDAQLDLLDQTQHQAQSTQAEESDTMVELGDQVAQWYITDEYKRSSGIMENCINNPTSSPTEEVDSDWEIV